MRRFLKIIAWFFGIIFGLILIVFLLFWLPPVQNFLAQKAIDFYEKKTGQHASLDRLHIQFPLSVSLQGLYVEDDQKDTLLYAEEIDVAAGLSALMDQHIRLTEVDLEGITANIIRSGPDSTFNFQFILEAFASDSTPKDTSAAAWRFTLAEASLERVNGKFVDHTTGMDVRWDIDRFGVSLDEFDLDSMRFGIDELELENAMASLTSHATTSPAPSEPDTAATDSTSGVPISITINEAVLQEIYFKYASIPDSSSMLVSVNDLNLNDGDFAGPKSKIRFDVLRGNGLYYSMSTAASSSDTVQTDTTQEASGDALFPDFGWDILGNRLEISESNFIMTNTGAGLSDDEGMRISDLHVLIRDIDFHKDHIAANIRQVSFDEFMNVSLNEFTADILLNDSVASVGDLAIRTAKSSVSGALSLKYASLQRVMEEGPIWADIQLQADINPNEVKRAMPGQGGIDTLRITRPITVDLAANGPANDVRINQFMIDAARNTRVRLSGNANLENLKDIAFNINLDTLTTSRQDVAIFMPSLTDTAGMQLPRQMGVSGRFSYRNAMVEGNVQLATTLGGARATVDYRPATDSVLAEVFVENFGIGEFIGNTMLGQVTMQASARVHMAEEGLPSGLVHGLVQHLDLNDTALTNLHIVAAASDSMVKLSSSSDAEVLKFELSSEIKLGGAVQDISMILDLQEAQLVELGFWNGEKLNVSTRIEGEAQIDTLYGTTIQAAISNLDFRKMHDSHDVDTIHIDMTLEENHYRANINSSMLDARVDGNIQPGSIPQLVMQQATRFVMQSDTVYQEYREQHLSFSLKPKNMELFTFLIDGLSEVNINEIRGAIQARDVELHLDVPQVVFKNQEINDLQLDATSSRDSLRIRTTIDYIKVDSLVILNPRILARFDPGKALVGFESLDAEEKMKYYAWSSLRYKDEALHVSIPSDSIILNYNKWQVASDNELRFQGKDVSALNTTLTYEDQMAQLNVSEEHIVLDFEHFEITNITGILDRSPEERFLGGALNGTIRVNKDLKPLEPSTELTISDLTLDKKQLGDLTLNLEMPQDSLLLTDITLDDDNNNMRIEGQLNLVEENLPMDLNINIDFGQLNDIRPLVENFLSDISGKLTADLDVTGNTLKPEVDGRLNFRNVRLTTSYTNSHLRLPNETIQFNGTTANFSNFSVRDSIGNVLDVNGTIDYTNTSTPAFDLDISTDRFLAVSGEADNDKTIYGSLYAAVDVQLTGNTKAPQVDASFAIQEGTDVVYVMPPSDLKMVTHEDVVVFSPVPLKQDTTKLNTQVASVADTLVRQIAGLTLNANLDVDPAAKFKIIIDPASGDYATFSLDGDLNYAFSQEETGQLNGNVEISEGLYQLQFYGLVKKTFNIQPGSSVYWSGDIMDGRLNVEAQYTVKTNAIGLIESGTQSTTQPGQFNEVLPYYVIINVNGSLSQPNVGFGIGLPQRYRNNYPILGETIQSLNQSQNEDELNQQVFSLLVTGSFMKIDPGTTTAQDQNFATNAARNSVSGILTSQLNNLTGKYVKGVNLDVGVNTFEAYEGGQVKNQTQLDLQASKTFLNDRLTVEAESHVDLDDNESTNPRGRNMSGVPEFTVSYDITEDGQYKVKAFRENAFDLFDGEIMNAGIALIFVKEFGSKYENLSKEDKSDKKDGKEEKNEDQEAAQKEEEE